MHTCKAGSQAKLELRFQSLSRLSFILKPLARGDTEILRPNGRARRNSGYALSRCGTHAPGRRPEHRALLRPRLSAKSAQRKLAMRLSRRTDVDESGGPVDHESMASVYGANNLVHAFQRSLGTQIIANVRECTDRYFYGGIGRTTLSRRPGQTMDGGRSLP